MQKLQTLSLHGFMVFAAFGIGILLGHFEYSSDTHYLRADVLAGSTPDATPASEGVGVTPEVIVPTVAVPVTSGLVVAAEMNVVEDEVKNMEEVKIDEVKKAQEVEDSEELKVVNIKTPSKEDAPLTEKPEESTASATEKKSDDSLPKEKSFEIISAEIKPGTQTATIEPAETKLETKPEITSEIKTEPLPLQPSRQTNSQSDDALKMTIQEAKRQPQINKKIIDAIGALRSIPDLLDQIYAANHDSENDDTDDADRDTIAENESDKHANTSKNFLNIMTNVIKALTENLQQNTVALENTLDYIYKQQGTNISHGRCIMTSYVTYSDAENSCVMIARKVCKINDIIPDNRYENMESCQRDHNLIYADESREEVVFKRQKEEYLRRLTSLQQTYKYYSVRWEELVDLVKDSENFESLGTAGNAVNAYRTEQIEVEPEKTEKKETKEEPKKAKTPSSDDQKDPEEKVSPPARKKLRPLPAASIE